MPSSCISIDIMTEPSRPRLPTWAILGVLALLVVLTYLPLFTQPLLEDDYPNIAQARSYDGSFLKMVADPIFRARTTTWILMDGVHQLFGMKAAAYYSAMILLHVLNTWLVYALGVWPPLGYRLTAFAAGFFAVYEGHQEAVMWLSGSTEPLVLFFGLLAFICLVGFLDGRGLVWYIVSLLSFCGALLSKESAVILVPILALPIMFDRKRWRQAMWLLPFAALAAVSAISVSLTRAYSFRFQDGSFSLHAPFWLTWPTNFARLFWFWGLLSLVAILIWKSARYREILSIGLAWAGIGLIPYSFLTYSSRIPSRQTHLASVGIAMIVGLALLSLYDRYWSQRRALVIAVCAVMVVHNISYLWTKKRGQFLARAAPTEQLIALARATKGPIYVQCFPRTPLVANMAVALMAGKSERDLIWDPEEAHARHAVATFCYSKP
jgi:hypothetical protein